MFEEELPESDSSDEDFVPTGEKSDLSEEDSDDADAEHQEEELQNGDSKRKKTKSKKGSRKKKKKIEEDIPSKNEEEEEKPKQEENPEEKKKRADALWTDFLKDCGPTSKKKTDEMKRNSNCEDNSKTTQSSAEDGLQPQTSTSKPSESKVNDIFKDFETDKKDNTITEVYEFAGEKVVVEKKVDSGRSALGSGKGGGVAAILSHINKKNKLSTLQKSKLDWDSFKQSQGISEEIAAHNRGKNGFLEKLDFLERSDLRQFEIEKKLREHNRSNRL